MDQQLVQTMKKATKAVAPRSLGIESVFQVDADYKRNRSARYFSFDDLRDIILLSNIAVDDDALLGVLNIFEAFLASDGKYSLQVLSI